MPGKDGTGPYGTGVPGRGLGPCRKGRTLRTIELTTEEKRKVLEAEKKAIENELKELK